MLSIEELKEKALNELKENDELFVDMVNEMDSWNGYADGFRAFPMYELDDLFCDCKVSEFLDKLAPSFKLRDEYMIDSIYGLDSTNDIVAHYRANVWESELLDAIIDNANHIYFNDNDFEELIDDIVNFEEEDETAAA